MRSGPRKGMPCRCPASRFPDGSIPTCGRHRYHIKLIVPCGFVPFHEIADDIECPICYEHCEKVDCYTTKCSHTFHKTCIQTWFRSGGYTCPLCRGSEVTVSSHPPPYPTPNPISSPPPDNTSLSLRDMYMRMYEDIPLTSREVFLVRVIRQERELMYRHLHPIVCEFIESVNDNYILSRYPTNIAGFLNLSEWCPTEALSSVSDRLVIMSVHLENGEYRTSMDTQ